MWKHKANSRKEARVAPKKNRAAALAKTRYRLTRQRMRMREFFRRHPPIEMLTEAGFREALDQWVAPDVKAGEAEE